MVESDSLRLVWITPQTLLRSTSGAEKTIPKLVEFARHFRGEPGIVDATPLLPQLTPDMVKELAHEGNLFLAAVKSGDVIGFLHFTPKKVRGVVQLHLVAVQNRYRQQGVGQALLGGLIGYARARGYSSIEGELVTRAGLEWMKNRKNWGGRIKYGKKSSVPAEEVKFISHPDKRTRVRIEIARSKKHGPVLNALNSKLTRWKAGVRSTLRRKSRSK